MNPTRTLVTIGRLMAVVLCVATTTASSVVPSSFTVSPTQVFLTARASSTMLTLTNESQEALRFQLQVFKWDQSPSGEMLLTPTEDVVFFPQLVELKSREARKIRVGTTSAFGAVERTYRIFVEELPALVTPGRPATGVQMRTRMGIPIFMQPVKATAGGTLTEPATAKGRITLKLENRGSVHFIADTVRVIGQTAAGTETFSKIVNGWYVLAGGSHVFEFALTDAECKASATLLAEAKIGETVLRSQAKLDSTGCAAPALIDGGR
jgi:fimbrial chaperone protein